MGCFCVISFANIDITQKANTQNVQYANKLTSAGYDAAQSMKVSNLEATGQVWINTDDLNNTLDTFYTSLSYSFDKDTSNADLAIYTPVVCLIDTNGYYISHNVVFDKNSSVSESDTADNRNGLTQINTWTEKYGAYVLRYYLGDRVDVVTGDNNVFTGNRFDVYHLMQDKGYDIDALAILNDSTGINDNGTTDSKLINDNEFEQAKRNVIVQSIQKQCEYYINQHNVIGDDYEMKYSYEMPEISGEDWNRLLQHPTVISFLQGYSTHTDNRLLNVYSLAAGELVPNNHYFIDDSNPDNLIYHCIETNEDLHKEKKINDPVVTETEGIKKTVTTIEEVYTYNGKEIDTLYNTQTACAQQGARPGKDIYGE